MEPHQQRVVDEQKELEGRLIKLRQFIGEHPGEVGPIFATLPPMEQVRMILQAHYMSAYNDILKDRIAAFHIAGLPPKK